jgi:hypothetical protein
MGPAAGLDAVVKRKIPNTFRNTEPRTPTTQPVAQRYTTELPRNELIQKRDVEQPDHKSRVITYLFIMRTVL